MTLTYKCPICNSHLKKLYPFGLKIPVLTKKKVIGGGYRLNALCPVCYSTDRERLAYLYLSKKTNIFTEVAKLLHVAPEPGLSKIIKKHSNIDYLTADISSDDVMVKMDITEINFPDKTFDIIICNHVLEHIVDDRKAMRELFRVLKPGGWGILQVPMSLSIERTYEDYSITDPAEREQAFGQSDHVRIYAADYQDRLEESGFQSSRFNWEEDKEFEGANNRYGLLQDESVFIVNKPQQPPLCRHNYTNSTKKQNKSLKIAFFTHYAKFYGANRSLLNLIAGLQAREHNIYVVAPAEGPVVEYLRSHSYEVLVCPFVSCHKMVTGRNEDESILRITRQFHAIEIIKNQIDGWNIDLIYSNSSVIDIGLIISRLMSKPHVWHIREYGDLDFDLIPDLQNRGFRRLLHEVDNLVFVSKTLNHYFAEGVPFVHAKTIYNGVLSRHTAYELKEQKKLQPENKIMTFSFVGHMSPNKGQHVALAALKIIISKGFKAKIIFAGDGPILDSFISRIAKLKLQDYTEVLGAVNDPFAVFMRSDATLMCSKHEAMGRVTVEAMACSIPVIGNNSGATPELIVDGVTGFLYNGTVGDLAQKMMWCIANRSTLKEYGENAFDHFIDNFTQEIYVENIDNFITKVVQRNSRRHINLSTTSRISKLELMYESILNR